jgi:hypothetical protein
MNEQIIRQRRNYSYPYAAVREADRRMEGWLRRSARDSRPFRSRIRDRNTGLTAMGPDMAATVLAHPNGLPVALPRTPQAFSEELISAALERSDLLNQYEISPSEFIHALKLVEAVDATPTRAREVINQLSDYDVPIAQSPTITLPSVSELLKSTKSVVLLPLASGSAAASFEIATGNPVLALRIAETAGVASLLFLGPAVVIELVFRYLSRNQAS